MKERKTSDTQNFQLSEQFLIQCLFSTGFMRNVISLGNSFRPAASKSEFGKKLDKLFSVTLEFLQVGPRQDRSFH